MLAKGLVLSRGGGELGTLLLLDAMLISGFRVLLLSSSMADICFFSSSGGLL